MSTNNMFRDKGLCGKWVVIAIFSKYRAFLLDLEMFLILYW